jgi:hypothetical protein
MKKLVVVVLMMVAAVAGAGTGSGSGSTGSAATPCDPFTSPHGCSANGEAKPDGSAAAFRMPVPDAPAVPPPASSAEQLRATCAAAMNADPEFARSIVSSADKQIDQKTIAAHEDALHHIQKNENHVIYAYAAMWVIAALLVAFLWKRQQALRGEIAALRSDLAKAEDKS